MTCNNTCQEGVGKRCGWAGAAGLSPPTLISAPHTCGISCRGSAWRVGPGGGVGHRAHPGKRGLRSLHPTGSRRVPRGPYRPCPGQPGIPGRRSWVPRGPEAPVGSVRSGNSLEALLPHLSRTWWQISHGRTRTDTDRCARGQPKYFLQPLSQTTDGHVRPWDRRRQPAPEGRVDTGPSCN